MSSIQVWEGDGIEFKVTPNIAVDRVKRCFDIIKAGCDWSLTWTNGEVRVFGDLYELYSFHWISANRREIKEIYKGIVFIRGIMAEPKCRGAFDGSFTTVGDLFGALDNLANAVNEWYKVVPE